MIFGFNTDIRVESTVYHVQTELREQDRQLESQVFVSGRCIGKRCAPLPADASEEEAQEMARAQHRWVVEAMREGFVDDVINQDADESLVVQFLGSQRISSKEVVLKFRVLRGGSIAPSVQMVASWKSPSDSGVLAETQTDDAGVAEMRVGLAGEALELEIKASLESRETMRRFLVKSSPKAGGE